MPKPASKSTKESGTFGQESFNTCVIATGTKIEGNFQSAENIRLDGEIIGDLSCEKKLVLGPSGRIKGNVSAREAVVMGVVIGDLDIKGSLHLDRSASVNGDVTAALLSIEEGALYHGTCEVKK